MAVQKSKVSRARRGKRRTHDVCAHPTLSTDRDSGEVHRRHHLSKEGYYKGRLMVTKPSEDEQDEG